MTAIADLLTEFPGHAVYLPHRDGMEFRLVRQELMARSRSGEEAGHFLHAAIFALDIYQLVAECNCVVWNLNGRVPDEGAVSEAAIAWTLGKPIVAYKEDVRSLITGRDNPLLVGLVDFETLSDLQQIPTRLEELLRNPSAEPVDVGETARAIATGGGAGKFVMGGHPGTSSCGNNQILADVVTDLFAPQRTL